MKEEQISAFREKFYKVQARDLEDALQAEPIKLTRRQVKKIFHGIDIDRSNTVEFEEFIQVVDAVEKLLGKIGKKEDEDEGGSIQTGLYNTLSDVVKKPSMISTIGSDRSSYDLRMSNSSNTTCHYVEGAKLLALTPRQLERRFQMLNDNIEDNTSSYSQLLALPLDSFLEEQARKRRLKQAKQRKAAQKQRDEKKIVQEWESDILDGIAVTPGGRQKETRKRSKGKEMFKQKQKGEQKVVQKRAVFDRVPVTLGSWQKGTSKKQREKEKLKRAIDYRDFVVRRHQISRITDDFYRRVHHGALWYTDRQYGKFESQDIKLRNTRRQFQNSLLAYTKDKNFPETPISPSYAKVHATFVRLPFAVKVKRP